MVLSLLVVGLDLLSLWTISDGEELLKRTDFAAFFDGAFFFGFASSSSLSAAFFAFLAFFAFGCSVRTSTHLMGRAFSSASSPESSASFLGLRLAGAFFFGF